MPSRAAVGTTSPCRVSWRRGGALLETAGASEDFLCTATGQLSYAGKMPIRVSLSLINRTGGMENKTIHALPTIWPGK